MTVPGDARPLPCCPPAVFRRGQAPGFVTLSPECWGILRPRNPDAHALTGVALCHQGKAIRTEFGLAASAPNEDTEPSASALGHSSAQCVSAGASAGVWCLDNPESPPGSVGEAVKARLRPPSGGASSRAAATSSRFERLIKLKAPGFGGGYLLQASGEGNWSGGPLMAGVSWCWLLANTSPAPRACVRESGQESPFHVTQTASISTLSNARIWSFLA